MKTFKEWMMGLNEWPWSKPAENSACAKCGAIFGIKGYGGAPEGGRHPPGTLLGYRTQTPKVCLSCYNKMKKDLKTFYPDVDDTFKKFGPDSEDFDTSGLGMSPKDIKDFRVR